MDRSAREEGGAKEQTRRAYIESTIGDFLGAKDVGLDNEDTEKPLCLMLEGARARKSATTRHEQPAPPLAFDSGDVRMRCDNGKHELQAGL
jgi:hypothetical protein